MLYTHDSSPSIRALILNFISPPEGDVIPVKSTWPELKPSIDPESWEPLLITSEVSVLITCHSIVWLPDDPEFIIFK